MEAKQYPNYAISGTSVQNLYGDKNAERLERIREEIDPERIMELAGGFDL